jgi:hypothetical protein
MHYKVVRYDGADELVEKLNEEAKSDWRFSAMLLPPGTSWPGIALLERQSTVTSLN